MFQTRSLIPTLGLLGGLGGAKNASGTFFDRVEIPTTENRPLTYKNAPLLVCDITVTDADGRKFTLDGVLGMNYLSTLSRWSVEGRWLVLVP